MDSRSGPSAILRPPGFEGAVGDWERGSPGIASKAHRDGNPPEAREVRPRANSAKAIDVSAALGVYGEAQRMRSRLAGRAFRSSRQS
jgi:hypothetical protein